MADHSTHHHDDSHSSDELKSKTAFRSSFWFMLILVGLFIAALNFVEVMSHEGHESKGHETHEATATPTGHGEAGPGHEAAATSPAAAHDSATHEGHEEGHH